jgi:zinc D-Ala-D-Ala carboxypeptidase
LKDANWFEDVPKKSSSSVDDIPEAFRDTPIAATPQSFPTVLWIGVGMIVLSAIAGGGLWWMQQNQGSRPGTGTPAKTVTPPSPVATSPSSSQPGDRADQLLGHLAYAEAPQAELELIAPNSQIKLRQSAAAAFRQMVAAAQADGVALVPISGFRTMTDQNYLFFDVKAQRKQSAQQRAEVSAPPGYSEHHTGYAVDIGDGTSPALDLNPDFEKTSAFQWLQANATQFSFELSFPRHNPQGVKYEPWHWRFVGNRASLETFYKARGASSKPSS